MRVKLVVAMVVSAGFLAAGDPVVAHHAFAAECDANKPIKLDGTVTKMEWINPHREEVSVPRSRSLDVRCPLRAPHIQGWISQTSGKMANPATGQHDSHP